MEYEEREKEEWKQEVAKQFEGFGYSDEEIDEMANESWAETHWTQKDWQNYFGLDNDESLDDCGIYISEMFDD